MKFVAFLGNVNLGQPKSPTRVTPSAGRPQLVNRENKRPMLAEDLAAALSLVG